MIANFLRTQSKSVGFDLYIPCGSSTVVPMSDKYDRAFVEGCLRLAGKQLCALDKDLFVARINERTLTARLAMYLQTLFPDEHVDCEYDRDWKEPNEHKRLLSNTLRALKGKLEENASPEDTDGCTVFPDIIVHQRRTKMNHLVIEAKKTGSRIPRAIDEEKLKAYQEELGYMHAYFVEFDMEEITMSFQRVESSLSSC